MAVAWYLLKLSNHLWHDKLIVLWTLNRQAEIFLRKSLSYPLKFIFDASFEEGVYLELCQKANIVPVHKQESKNWTKVRIKQWSTKSKQMGISTEETF